METITAWIVENKDLLGVLAAFLAIGVTLFIWWMDRQKKAAEVKPQPPIPEPQMPRSRIGKLHANGNGGFGMVAIGHQVDVDELTANDNKMGGVHFGDEPKPKE